MGTSKDILIDKIYELKKENERVKNNTALYVLNIEKLEEERGQLNKENKRFKERVKELEGIAFGYSHKLIIANQEMGELFKERDELYDKYVNKDTLRFRNKGE